MKIHIAVDVLGLPYANMVTTANVTYRNGAIEMFSQPDFSLPSFKTLLCDGGYTGENFAERIRELTGAEVQIAKRSELRHADRCDMRGRESEALRQCPRKGPGEQKIRDALLAPVTRFHRRGI